MHLQCRHGCGGPVQRCCTCAATYRGKVILSKQRMCVRAACVTSRAWRTKLGRSVTDCFSDLMTGDWCVVNKWPYLRGHNLTCLNSALYMEHHRSYKGWKLATGAASVADSARLFVSDAGAALTAFDKMTKSVLLQDLPLAEPDLVPCFTQ